MNYLLAIYSSASPVSSDVRFLPQTGSDCKHNHAGAFGILPGSPACPPAGACGAADERSPDGLRVTGNAVRMRPNRRPDAVDDAA